MEIETKISSKKLKRLENRQKKMLAYLEMVKLNDQDRENKQNTAQLDNNNLPHEDEPSYKKLKIENISDKVGNCDNKTKMDEKYISKEDLLKYKEELKERRSKVKNVPTFRLKDVGYEASIVVTPDERIPLFISDVQHLIMFVSLGNYSSYFPHRWCSLEKMSKITRTAVIIVENVSLLHFTNNVAKFININKIFENKIEIVTPSVYKGDLVEEIAAVPLTSTQKQKLIQQYGSLDDALKSAKVFSLLKAVFPVQERSKLEKEKKMVLPETDKFPRTHLLLSAWQLVQENYPLPLKGVLKYKFSDYIMTKDIYEEVTPNSPMFAVDCEMCKTTSGLLELTRVSVVDEKHTLLYETFVKPDNKIVDYLTQFSGITPESLKDVTTRLEDVQRDLRSLLPADAILVGQSLNSDLNALKLMHPYCIDTSVIFNITGDRIRKTKLKTLVAEFLSENIQQGNEGHCSVEDSIAALKLVQLKLANYLEFGDAVLSGQAGCLRDYRNSKDNYYGSSLLHHITKIDKNVALCATITDINRYKKFVHLNEISKTNRIIFYPEYKNDLIVKTTCEKMEQYDLIFTHLKINVADLREEVVEKTCSYIDEQVKNIWSQLGNNSLCILVFGGEDGVNGASFVQMKRDTVK